VCCKITCRSRFDTLATLRRWQLRRCQSLRMRILMREDMTPHCVTLMYLAKLDNRATLVFGYLQRESLPHAWTWLTHCARGNCRVTRSIQCYIVQTFVGTCGLADWLDGKRAEWSILDTAISRWATSRLRARRWTSIPSARNRGTSALPLAAGGC
jgi:hypothetical protein